jgi:hypothetical protein
MEGLKELRKHQVKAKKRQGEETRAKVRSALRSLEFADYRQDEQAALIAKRLNKSERTVRRHLQSIRKNDK